VSIFPTALAGEMPRPRSGPEIAIEGPILAPGEALAATAIGGSMLRVENVEKSFKVRGGLQHDKGPSSIVALQDVSLEVRQGEFISFLGASGCGKTTLLRLIAGLLRPDKGSIYVGSQPVKGPRKDLCMVFQNFGLLPWRTVLANVAFPLEIDGIAKAERDRIAREYLDLVGLTSFESHFPHELSGGMQQRVGIARALVRKPLVLLMDEPFAALDAQTREKLQDDFLSIWSRLKTTIVFVTHAIDEAFVLSDRVFVFSSRPGRVKRVIDSPVAPYRLKEDVRALPEFAEQTHMVRELLRPERTS
jgi:NitT/TauT family transport system ATP-binding protein